MEFASKTGETRMQRELDFHREHFFEDSSQFLFPMNTYFREKDLINDIVNSLSAEDSEGSRIFDSQNSSSHSDNSQDPSSPSEGSATSHVVKKLIKKVSNKNSNVIKKIGRYIIDHRDLFYLGTENLGIKEMTRLLMKRAKVKGRIENMRDKCNCGIIRSLFTTPDEEINRRNL